MKGLVMDPWFNEQTAGMLGGILGGSLGGMGAIIGCIGGLCVRKGWKKLLYGLFGVCIIVCAALLITGVIALLSRQPYHVWYVFGLPGLIGTSVFGGLFPMIRRRFTENELRQMQAKDI
jgi:hypothetical protein